MARVAKELSRLEVSRIKKSGLHFVGGVPGLILQVTETGARTWILRATIGSKRRDLGLGGYPSVTLGGAKDAARLAREKIRQGIDPIEERSAAKSALLAARAAEISFKEAGEKYVAAAEGGWKNLKHAAQWTSTLEMYVLLAAVSFRTNLAA